jgi:hypothetical protein
VIRHLLLLGALALALGAAVRLTTASIPAAVAEPAAGKARPAAPAQTLPSAEVQPRVEGEGRPRWEELWSRAAPGLAAMALAGDGATVAWVDRAGSVRGMDGRGRTLWRTPPLPGVNRLVALPGSGNVIAYSWLNPERPLLRVVGPGPGGVGKTLASYPTEGAIWNVAVSPDGRYVLAGTGQRFLYVFSPEPDGTLTAVARWEAPGIPESVSAGTVSRPASGPLALLGTWQEAGVSAWSLDSGKPRWRYLEPESARLYQIHVSGDGARAVGVSASGPRGAGARLHVWDARTGVPLWTKELDASRPKVLTTREGGLVAASYVKTLNYRTGEATARKLALYDSQGRKLWEKGGEFFSPTLVALSPDGGRLTVADGANTLYTLDARGHFVSQLRFPVNPKTDTRPTIQEAVATPDAGFLLVRRGDGQICLLKAT